MLNNIFLTITIIIIAFIFKNTSNNETSYKEGSENNMVKEEILNRYKELEQTMIDKKITNLIK